MEKSNDSFNWALAVFGFGLIICILGIIYFGPDTTKTNYQKDEYVYYDIPTYTTTYEIVYPDSAWRYTCTSHYKMMLSSHRGTNTLQPDYPLSWHRNNPVWYNDNWKEPYVSTTAPIRIIRDTVTYKRTKFKYK